MKEILYLLLFDTLFIHSFKKKNKKKNVTLNLNTTKN